MGAHRQGQSAIAMVGVSAVVVIVLLVTGLFYFRKTERTFADLV